ALVEDQHDSLQAVGATVEISGDRAIIATQPVLLRQVFVNLVGNAVKYRRLDVPLRIGIKLSLAANGELQILVSDNGRGFEMQDERIMLRLLRRLSQDCDNGGAGIGLDVCRNIVEQLAGRIEAAGITDADAILSNT